MPCSFLVAALEEPCGYPDVLSPGGARRTHDRSRPNSMCPARNRRCARCVLLRPDLSLGIAQLGLSLGVPARRRAVQRVRLRARETVRNFVEGSASATRAPR